MDKYDAEIEVIVGEILEGKGIEDTLYRHWESRNHRVPVLFAYCSVDGKRSYISCGCLTQVRSGMGRVYGPNGLDLGLTEEILKDERLHSNPSLLARDIEDCYVREWGVDAIRMFLQPYAEWQRRLDSTIRSV